MGPSLWTGGRSWSAVCTMKGAVGFEFTAMDKKPLRRGAHLHSNNNWDSWQLTCSPAGTARTRSYTRVTKSTLFRYSAWPAGEDTRTPADSSGLSKRAKTKDLCPEELQ